MVRQLCGEARSLASATEQHRMSIGHLTVAISGPRDLLSRMMSRILPSSREPDVHFAIIDGVEAEPPPPWNLPHAGPAHLSRLHQSADSKLIAQYDPDRRYWWLFDRVAKFGALWATDLARLPDWELAAPFRLLGHWALLPTDHTIVHSGAMLAGDRALLLVGPGGSGKSTTVAAAALAGIPVLGDDLVIVGPSEGGTAVYALHDAVKIGADSPIRGRLQSAGLRAEASAGKSVYRLSEIAGREMQRRASVAALVAVEIGHEGKSSIEPAPPAAMLRALAPSTVFLLRGGEHETISKLSTLVRSLPCFRVRLGPDPVEAAVTLAEWGGRLP